MAKVGASIAPVQVPADVATSVPRCEDPRAFIPEPMPLAEAEEIPLPIHEGGLLRALSFVLAHHMRTAMPWVPVMAAALALRPKQTAMVLAAYWGVLSPQLAWKNMVHKWAGWASSNKPRLLNCMRQKTYDPSKQYIVACHPHGFLLENIANIFMRDCPEFKTKGFAPPFPGLGPVSCCFAPAVGWYPVYCELGAKSIVDASAVSMRNVLAKGKSALVAPGGFSEAVYVGASKDFDHVYLAGRVGFLKLAIERGIDVAPVYGFGVSSAYSGLEMFEKSRHRRSVMSQDRGLPGVLPVGRLGTAIPYDESYVTVLLDPFPTSKYSVDQLEQCSQDYAAYLQRCFDAYRGCKASEAHRELLIVGKHVDHNMASNNKLRSRL